MGMSVVDHPHLRAPLPHDVPQPNSWRLLSEGLAVTTPPPTTSAPPSPACQRIAGRVCLQRQPTPPAGEDARRVAREHSSGLAVASVPPKFPPLLTAGKKKLTARRPSAGCARGARGAAGREREKCRSWPRAGHPLIWPMPAAAGAPPAYPPSPPPSPQPTPTANRPPAIPYIRHWSPISAQQWQVTALPLARPAAPPVATPPPSFPPLPHTLCEGQSTGRRLDFPPRFWTSSQVGVPPPRLAVFLGPRPRPPLAQAPPHPTLRGHPTGELCCCRVSLFPQPPCVRGGGVSCQAQNV